jgi:glycosyltransferase involved in cell wall biosynthesis
VAPSGPHAVRHALGRCVPIGAELGRNYARYVLTPQSESVRARERATGAGAERESEARPPEAVAPAWTPLAAVTLVLPCLNEEDAVGACVEHALRVMRAANLDGRVIVVDNGSNDQSVTAAKRAGARVFHQSERGYGAALRSGIEAADSEYVVMADADGTYELEAIPRLLQPLIDGTADLVLGARVNEAEIKTMPWLHRFIGTPTLSMLVNRASGQKAKIRDSQSGFRAFRRDQMLAVTMTSTGMEYASEMLIRCAWARFRIVEVTTRYSSRIGESKLDTFPDGVRHLRQILLLSPEIFATDPGLLMTVLAFVLWSLASFSAEGLGRIGSLSWLGILAAGILGVIGPITYCTGLVIRYRAQSLGLRHSPPKRPIDELIRRFFFAGITLMAVAISLVVLVVVNFHLGRFISNDAVRVIVSVAGSSAIVGIFLASTPLLTPFLRQGPALVLPDAHEDL